MTGEMQKGAEVAANEWFEQEFRRVYSQLYPDEKALKAAISHYRKEYPYMELSNVDPDPGPRIEDVRYWLKPDKTIEEMNAYDKKPKVRSNFLFSDIKEIIGETPVDVVFLSLAVRGSSLIVTDESWKAPVGKCICGLKNNGIQAGNFARVLWNSGVNYIDAVEDGLISPERETFEACLSEPTYERPVIVVTEVCKEGEMLADYIGFLRDKGIACLSWKPPKAPGFSFIGRDYAATRDIGYVLDTLDDF